MIPFRRRAVVLSAILPALGCAAPSAVTRTDAAVGSASTASHFALLPSLQQYADGLLSETASISPERKELLERIAKYVRDRRAVGEPARLVFVCTHNSRRSQMSQLLAAMAAMHRGVDGVETFSGGTEATAFNPRAVAAMRRAGFEIADGAGENPRYQATLATGHHPMTIHSKRYDDAVNPQEGFAAVMTCSQADRSCPTVAGSALRLALPYEDPKAADNTPEEADAYDTRARQIATEMLYLFDRVRS